MSDRRWILNKKCFAALRAIGDATDRRWKYIHVGPKGVTCTDKVSMIRISLPKENGINLGNEPAIFDYKTAKKLSATRSMSLRARTNRFPRPKIKGISSRPCSRDENSEK